MTRRTGIFNQPKGWMNLIRNRNNRRDVSSTRKGGNRNDVTNRVMPPVMTRSNSFVSGNQVVQKHRSSKIKRRYDVSISKAGTQGVEMRFPSLPVVHPGWRIFSFFLLLGSFIGLYFLFTSPAFMVKRQATAPQSSAGSELPEGAVVVAGDEAEVEIEDFQFRPKVLVISVGTTVKFANKDRAPHTATSDTSIFDSGYLSKGQEWFYTFTEPGTYPYYCIPHGGPGGVGMAATIIVQP